MKLKLKSYDMVEYDFSADEKENVSDNMHYDWDLPDNLPEEPDLYAEFKTEKNNREKLKIGY